MKKLFKKYIFEEYTLPFTFNIYFWRNFSGLENYQTFRLGETNYDYGKCK